MTAWDALYTAGTAPTLAQIGAFIGTPRWEAFRAFVESTWDAAPLIEYSKCCGARGWNVKYKKGGRALCTLYPREGYFICLVSVGAREEPEAEAMLGGMSAPVQSLYQNAKPFNGARWLMIEVVSDAVLEDAKRLVLLRARPKQSGAEGAGPQ